MRRRHTTTRLLAIAALALPVTLPATPAAAATPTAPARHLSDVIPAPVQTPTPDAHNTFRITPPTVIRTTPGSAAARHVGNALAGILRPSTGYALPVPATSGTPTSGIALLLSGADAERRRRGLPARRHRRRASRSARRPPAGLFHGVQTLRQLLPRDVEARPSRAARGRSPAARIIDYPRYAYRGAMLDVVRHFFAVDEVKRYIDEIAQYKINYLHLHLSDDQGWRIAIDAWPRLADRTAAAPQVGGGAGRLLHQGRSTPTSSPTPRRGYITIVPEIDMPGHTNAALASYAELNCDGVGPAALHRHRVGFSSLCVSKEVTYTFVDDVLRELAALTPGPYLHIGGDEAQRTTDGGLRHVHEPRAAARRRAHGKTVIGWHQIGAGRPPRRHASRSTGAPTTPDARPERARRRAGRQDHACPRRTRPTST